MIIDGERLWRSIMDLAAIGALPSGGSRRLALTDADSQGRALFAEWCNEAGCPVEGDLFGNMFAVRPGRDPDAPWLLIGSHLDTQPDGGRFDGVAGVLAGLEIIRAMNDRRVRPAPTLAVVNWTNEEGARFRSSLSGSKGFCGVLSPHDARQLTAVDGPTFGAELDRSGYGGRFTLPHDRIKAYLELHIEQGPVLEKAGQQVGVVTAALGAHWFEVEVTGASRHAGATPHRLRADAYQAAASLATRGRDACLALSSDIRFTIGRLVVLPGSVNTIPGQVVFSIDLRHADTTVLEHAEHALRRLLAEIDRQEGTNSTMSRTSTVAPATFDSRLIGQIKSRFAAPLIELTSGAMHDACMMANIAPTAMIFIPCKDGISHDPGEWAEPDNVRAGCQLLCDAALSLMGADL